ncbi:MAG: hypothetical protein RLZZ522_256 [Verrucomicrobiota bacterium]
MGKLSSILVAALCGHALAGPPLVGPPAPAIPVAEATQAGPSRFAGADVKAYIGDLASHLSGTTRASDPFGQQQDPDAKPIVKPSATKITRRFTPVAPTPLSEIVAQIKIGMVMPKAKRFVVDSRNLGEGDKLPLRFNNTQIQTVITEVSASRIVFRNTETGEIGIHKFAALPLGMTPGNRVAPPPGMVSANANTPLEIGSPTPAALAP